MIAKYVSFALLFTVLEIKKKNFDFGLVLFSYALRELVFAGYLTDRVKNFKIDQCLQLLATNFRMFEI